MSILQEFINHMSQNGFMPKRSDEIKPTEKRTNYFLMDNKKKRTGFYKLKISGDFGYGFYGDYRTDECISWHSKSNHNISKEELARIKKEAEEEAKRHKEEIKKQHKEKAEEAKNFLLFLDEADINHPYLQRKGISAHGILQSGDKLIVPVYIKGKISNYQSIGIDGFKMFMAGARMAEGYYQIPATPDNGGTIYLCEGFATGASVHEATGAAVYVAFNAGNLNKVVPYIMKQEKGKKIVLAADNDHETIIKDKPFNTGIVKAEFIKKTYAIPYMFPEFNDPAGKTDFNDLHAEQGIKAVKESLEQAPKEEKKEIALQEDAPRSKVSKRKENWQEGFMRTSKGEIVPSSTVNARLVLEHDENVSDIFKFDAFQKKIILSQRPPWVEEEDFQVRAIQDYDFTDLECYLEREWGLRASKAKCADLILSVANLAANTINPAQSFFENLKWDGVPRLDGWLAKHVSDGRQDNEYLTLVGRKFMCGLAARAMNPGVKFDTMIIFEGKQYGGKSYLSRIMATAGGKEYFLDDFKDIDNKDALMKMQGKIVVEFPEISTLRRSEINDLKAFITRQVDEYREPYGRTVKVSPRQCVFVGTVNPEGPYFKDMTGNRRYWPVSCRDRLPLDDLKEIMPQLHAEAAQLVRAGEQLYLTHVEYEIAAIEQGKRTMSDLWVDKVEEILLNKTEITSDHLLQELGITTDKRTPLIYSRISQIMASCGWEGTRIAVGNLRKRGYQKKDALPLGEENYAEEVKW